MSAYPRVPRRLDRVFGHRPVYFVTFCTYRRRKLLARPEVHREFVSFSTRAYEEHNVAIGRYVIMPDHVHLFVCGDDHLLLSPWVGSLKRCLGKAVMRPASEDPIWQRGFFDHVLRSNESYAQKWDYVKKNPVRAGLTERSGDWPFAGEIITIDRA